MAKGDYVRVKSEIGGALVEDYVSVTQNGGKIEVEWDKKENRLVVSLLNRAGDPTRKHTYAGAAVRSVEEKTSDL